MMQMSNGVKYTHSWVGGGAGFSSNRIVAGKIHGGIGYDIFHNSTALVSFTYYLNPEPNSRNMEFNTKSNLFKNLSSLEQVSAP